MAEILNLFVLCPVRMCRFLYALFKKVWLGSREEGCQVMCSGCGWTMQRLLETGKNYSVSAKSEYTQLGKFSTMQTKTKRRSKEGSSDMRGVCKKGAATNFRSN